MTVHRCRRVAFRIASLMAIALLLVLACPTAPIHGHPAADFMSFYSSNSVYLGQPVPVAAVVTAHDPQGVQCGMYTVKTEGAYGLLRCYRDDPTTPVDEGPLRGEPISFRINGLRATAVPISKGFGTPVPPSTPIVWTQPNDIWEVDLRAPMPSVGGYSVAPHPLLGVQSALRWRILIGLALALSALGIVVLARPDYPAVGAKLGGILRGQRRDRTPASPQERNLGA